MQLQPTTFSFSGHETFPFRYSWLKKGVDAVAVDGAVFLRDEAMTTLGVGKNMVRSIRHWCQATGVVEPVEGSNRKPTGQFQPSWLGKALLADTGWDPYLEDPATLWLLHWQIASNLRRSTTWFWAFSHFHEPEFTREMLNAALLAWAQTVGARRLASTSLRRDVDCFLRTYVPSRQTKVLVLEDTLDCPLLELGLIRTAGDGQVFRFQRGEQPQLPSAVLFYALSVFWGNFAPTAEVLALHNAARQPGSPGQVFKIDETALAERCGEIEEWTNGDLSYDETAGLKQLYRRRKVEPLAVLERAYAAAASA
jgi:Protein of unknown function (DUF4007)